jgi:hypothetical protein
MSLLKSYGLNADERLRSNVVRPPYLMVRQIWRIWIWITSFALYEWEQYCWWQGAFLELSIMLREHVPIRLRGSISSYFQGWGAFLPVISSARAGEIGPSVIRAAASMSHIVSRRSGIGHSIGAQGRWRPADEQPTWAMNISETSKWVK